MSDGPVFDRFDAFIAGLLVGAIGVLAVIVALDWPCATIPNRTPKRPSMIVSGHYPNRIAGRWVKL